ncbi:hypothetical protein ACOSQ4_002021 [Xanthoceras sorbifolium]
MGFTVDLNVEGPVVRTKVKDGNDKRKLAHIWNRCEVDTCDSVVFLTADKLKLTYLKIIIVGVGGALGGFDAKRDEDIKANKENEDYAAKEPGKSDEVAPVEVDVSVPVGSSIVVLGEVDVSSASKSYFMDEKVSELLVEESVQGLQNVISVDRESSLMSSRSDELSSIQSSLVNSCCGLVDFWARAGELIMEYESAGSVSASDLVSVVQGQSSAAFNFSKIEAGC